MNKDRVRIIRIFESDLSKLIQIMADSGDDDLNLTCDLLHQEITYVSEEEQLIWENKRAELFKKYPF